MHVHLINYSQAMKSTMRDVLLLVAMYLLTVTCFSAVPRYNLVMRGLAMPAKHDSSHCLMKRDGSSTDLTQQETEDKATRHASTDIRMKNTPLDQGASGPDAMFKRFDSFRNRAVQDENNARNAFARFDAFLQGRHDKRDQ